MLQAEFKFVGLRPRTKEQLQLLMYTEEMENWIAEAKQEEANSRARMQAAMLRDQLRSSSTAAAVLASSASSSVRRRRLSTGGSSGDNRQVVEDEETGEAGTVIHRATLPDL